MIRINSIGAIIIGVIVSLIFNVWLTKHLALRTLASDKTLYCKWKNVWKEDRLQNSNNPWWHRISCRVYEIVGAPIIEEAIFRGLVIAGLLRWDKSVLEWSLFILLWVIMTFLWVKIHLYSAVQFQHLKLKCLWYKPFYDNPALRHIRQQLLWQSSLAYTAAWAIAMLLVSHQSSQVLNCTLFNHKFSFSNRLIVGFIAGITIHSLHNLLINSHHNLGNWYRAQRWPPRRHPDNHGGQ